MQSKVCHSWKTGIYYCRCIICVENLNKKEIELVLIQCKINVKIICPKDSDEVEGGVAVASVSRKYANIYRSIACYLLVM